MRTRSAAKTTAKGKSENTRGIKKKRKWITMRGVYRTKLALNKKVRIPKYKIPKSKLENALRQIECVKSGNPPWEHCCLTPIHLINSRNYEVKKNPFTTLLFEARKCLLNRDWKNLATIMSCAKPISGFDNSHYFPSFLKYAAICLCHNRDNELMDAFLQGVASCATENEKQLFLQNLASL